MNESTFPPPHPHDPITAIADDMFMVRGCIQMNPLMRITRNMAIIRHQGELTLVNPIRLSEAAEEELSALGTVKRIMRLGPFHGVDDRYYVDRFNAEHWCQPGGKTYTEPKIDVEMSSATELPFPDARFLPFDGVKQPESVLILARDKGVMLSCDAIQHYGDYRHNNLPARIVMPFIGFPKTTLIGPIWLKYNEADRDALQSSFRRLLGYEFDALLSAHGSYLASKAKDAVRAAISKTYT